MESLAPWHIVVIGVVGLVLFFGWRQLPDMSRSLARSLRILKSETHDLAADRRELQQSMSVAADETRSVLRTAREGR